MAIEADYIIVGAGAAGGVLASRLAENSSNTVLLIEAGPDHSENKWVKTAQNYPFLLDIHNFGIGGGPFLSPSNWGFETTPQKGKVYAYPRGTGLGGSASHHALIDGRGLPSIYNEWAELTGDSTWRFENLLPRFRKMETYDVPGADEQVHGTKGWLHIRHAKMEGAFHEDLIRNATHDLDISFRKDLYDDPNNLYGIYQTDLQVHPDGRRSYVANDLLLPTYRHTQEQGWNNFEIKTDQLVTRVILEGKRAVGVEVIDAPRAYKVDAMHRKNRTTGERIVYHAREEVILCGGSINTPQLLMLSGIGPGDHLRTLDIEVAADLPGVGSGLQDHQDANLVYQLHNLPEKAWRWQILRASRVNPMFKGKADPSAIGEGFVPLMIDFHSGFDEDKPQEPDVHAFVGLGPFVNYNLNPFRYFEKGPLKTNFQALVAKTFNPLKPTPYHSFTAELFRAQQESGTIRLKSTDPTDQPLIDTHSGENEEGLTRLAMALQKLRALMQTPEMQRYEPEEILPGPTKQSLEETKEHIARNFLFGHHMTSTCQMGPEGAPTRVVDSQLRVDQIDGLRICDASVFPSTPGYNTSRACYILGEILAEKIQRGL